VIICRVPAVRRRPKLSTVGLADGSTEADAFGLWPAEVALPPQEIARAIVAANSVPARMPRET
jgi:hypothetical protein